MTSIQLKNVDLDYKIYNTEALNIRNSIISWSSGGLINNKSSSEIHVKALSNISLDFFEGDIIGLMGHNGSGKTSLLRLFAKIYEPTNGECNINGKVVSLIDPGAGFDPELRGTENIIRRGLLNGLDMNSIQNIMPQIIEKSGLGDFINLPIRTYSSGMITRLAFYTSFFEEPEILLIDEFFSTGDSNFQDKSTKFMLDMVKKSNIVVLASHSKDLITNLCNRFFLLEKGNLLEVSKSKLP